MFDSLFLSLTLLAGPPYEPRLLGPTMVEAWVNPALADVVFQAPGVGVGGGGGGVTVSGDNTWTGAQTFIDNKFSVVDDGDAARILTFQLSGLTAARVVTWPNSATTIPIISQILTVSGPTAARTITIDDAAQTLAARNRDNTFDAANIQTFNANHPASQALPTDAPFVKFQNSVDPTQNGFTVGVYDGSGIGMYFMLYGAEAAAGGGFHFLRDLSGLTEANAAQIYGDYTSRANPFMANKSSPQHGYYHSSSEGVMGMVTGVGNSRMVMSRTHATLTESAATTLVDINMADATGCGATITYTVWATNGTDHQMRTGRIQFQGVNKANAETCTMTSVAGTADTSITELEDGSGDGAISSGTLTYAVTIATGTNDCQIQINAVSSLTQTQLRGYWSAEFNPGAGATDSCAIVGG